MSETDSLSVQHSADVCSICLVPCLDASGTTLDECGHRFHASCIIPWFRTTKTCPVCRDPGDSTLRAVDIVTRATMLRRHSGSRDAPRQLVTLVAKWQRLEAQKRATKRYFKEFRQEHHEILKKNASLSRRVAELGNQIHTARREVGLFTHRDVIMPILHRYPHRLRMRRNNLVSVLYDSD